MRTVLAALAAAVLLALAAAACGGGSAGEATGAPMSVRELAASGSTSATARSGRFSFDVSAAFPGADEPFALSGEGAFDTASERASFSVDMSSLARLLGDLVTGLGVPSDADLPDFDDPSGWNIELIQDGDVEYVRLPAMDSQLPEGKKWVRGVERSSRDGFDFGELETAARTDPREVLDTLASVSGDVTTVGTEDLHGVETTHFRAAIDPVALAKAKDREGRGAPQSLVDQLTAPAAQKIPLDIWIDAEGFVRKLAMSVATESSSTARTGEASMTFELWDYNEPVGIELPPADEVVAASALRS